MTLHRDGSFAICLALLIALVRILYVREAYFDCHTG